MKTKQSDGILVDVNGLTDFLENFMKSYSNSNKIYRIDRLSCFVNSDLTDSEVEELGLDDYTAETADEEISSLIDECFVEALENYTAGLTKPRTGAKSEQNIRNSPDKTDDKLVKVLEHFLSLHEADEIFNMINNSDFGEDEVIGMLENYEDANYVNPYE